MVRLLSTFGLPALLDIATTLPGFGSSANAYGDALLNISRMIAAGTTHADILATSQLACLPAAYAAAALPTTSPAPPAGTATGTGAFAISGGSAGFTPLDSCP